MNSITPEACLKARELLGWTVYDLAGRAHCSFLTVRSFEGRHHRTSKSILSAIRRAFDEAGVEFSVAPDGSYEVHASASAVKRARRKSQLP